MVLILINIIQHEVYYLIILFIGLKAATSGQIFGLISSFLSTRRLRVVLDGKSSQEYPVNAGVPQGWSYTFPAIH